MLVLKRIELVSSFHCRWIRKIIPRRRVAVRPLKNLSISQLFMPADRLKTRKKLVKDCDLPVEEKYTNEN